jgi:DNA (cytosine-5)-methyltransferase 1
MLKVIELFAGVGAWSKALENLQIEHEVVAAVEFDKKTTDCYNIIHGTSFEPTDITTVNPQNFPDCDIICYSPPCQSFSVAGKGLGVEDSRGTLFWNALRVIAAKKPKYCLMENVKNLTGKKHKETFDKMLEELEDAGYVNYWKVLNAKDYGIPQNRERVFVISIRKDIAETYEFPQPFDNGLRLKDLLEDSVDEKYYISDEKCQKLLSQLKQPTDTSKPNLVGGFGEINFGKQYRQGNRVYDSGSIAMCLNSQPVGNMGGNSYLYAVPNEIKQIGNIVDTGNFDNPQRGRIYSPEGISPALNTCQGGGLEPKIIILGNIGRTGHHGEDVFSPEGISPTVKARDYKGASKVYLNYRIRKLTPLEVLRAMNFSDEDYHKLRNAKISDSQMYKIAGNSIVVAVCMNLFAQLPLDKGKGKGGKLWN